MAKRTPLYDLHQRLGAKMVVFAGWDMPLHYGSQIDEHHAVRHACGVFDVAHMLAIDVAGEGASRFLRRALANDVAKLQRDGAAQYSLLLNDGGGVRDDLIVYRRAPQVYRLVVNAGTAASDFEALNALAIAFPVTLTPRYDLALLALQGPQTATCLARAMPEWAAAMPQRFHAADTGTVCIARTGYTGEDGVEVMLPAASAAAVFERLVAAGARPCGLGARDTLRLEAGLPLFGHEMDESVSPFDCGLGWVVDDTSERDYIGRAALVSRPATQQLLGLLPIGGAIARAGAQVRSGDYAGIVTSGAFAPSLDCAAALVRLSRAVTPGAAAVVLIRGKEIAARCVKLPFVRAGKILIT
jgi:aminomethyltransferase